MKVVKDCNEARLCISARQLLEIRPSIDSAVSLKISGVGGEGGACPKGVLEYLLRFFEGEAEVDITTSAGVKTVLLRDFGRELEDGEAAFDDGNGECELLVKGRAGFEKAVYTFGDLMRIMERLTAREGCPWDLAQTHESIRGNMLEEAAEAVAAIDSGDTENLIEELGDVMLQSVFHADIARRSGEFDMSSVITRLCKKLFTRHTHVFGGVKAENALDALESWQQAKAREKASRN